MKGAEKKFTVKIITDNVINDIGKVKEILDRVARIKSNTYIRGVGK